MHKRTYKPLPTLSHELRAQLYAQLQHLEGAGLSAEQALKTLSMDDTLIGRRAEKMLPHIKRGKSLALAGLHTGLFQGMDAELVKIGEHSGNLAAVYGSLAEWHRFYADQLRRLKSRMTMPATILLLACFISPLPVLFHGASTWTYLWLCLQPILIVCFTGLLLWNLPRWLREDGWLGFLGYDDRIQELQLTTPKLGPLYTRHQIRNFMYALALMLRAGVPILEAIPKATEFIGNRLLQERLEGISDLLLDGYLFTEALEHIPEINPDNVALVKVGEISGSLDTLIMHWVNLESEDIALEDAQLAQWLGYLFYAGGMIWMMSLVFAGDANVPSPNSVGV